MCVPQLMLCSFILSQTLSLSEFWEELCHGDSRPEFHYGLELCSLLPWRPDSGSAPVWGTELKDCVEVLKYVNQDTW